MVILLQHYVRATIFFKSFPGYTSGLVQDFLKDRICSLAQIYLFSKQSISVQSNVFITTFDITTKFIKTIWMYGYLAYMFLGVNKGKKKLFIIYHTGTCWDSL